MILLGIFLYKGQADSVSQDDFRDFIIGKVYFIIDLIYEALKDLRINGLSKAFVVDIVSAGKIL